jgi:hypothetical protein
VPVIVILIRKTYPRESLNPKLKIKATMRINRSLISGNMNLSHVPEKYAELSS